MVMPTAELDIGAELVAARARGVCWKLLMRRFGLSRSRLNEIWTEAKKRPDFGFSAALPPVPLPDVPVVQICPVDIVRLEKPNARG